MLKHACTNTISDTAATGSLVFLTLMMSSLLDLHDTKVEISVMIPEVSMARTFTGIATVRPVRIAVLIISVSWNYTFKNIYI